MTNTSIAYRTIKEQCSVDSFPTVNHDQLKQYMVNFNPMNTGYDCKVTFRPACDLRFELKLTIILFRKVI